MRRPQLYSNLLRIMQTMFIGSTLLTGAARATAQQTVRNEKTRPDLGSIANGEYRNNFLGITYEFPKDWSVDKAAMDQANSDTRKFLDGGPNSDGWVGFQSFSLLKISQNPADGLRVLGPRLNLDVTSVPPKDETARDVLSGMKRLLSRQPTAQIVRDLTDCSFGGHVFVRMDVKWLLPGGNVAYEGDAVTIVKGYLVQFQIFADSPGQLDDLFGTLNSLQFSSNLSAGGPKVGF